MRRWRWRTFAAYAVVFAGLLAWWGTIRPSNDREWKLEVAVLPHATFNGDLVTVQNIRNFDYRSEADFTPAYYDKTFDLRTLESVDLIASYWAGPAIAHIFLSFGFGGDDQLAVSIGRLSGCTRRSIRGACRIRGKSSLAAMNAKLPESQWIDCTNPEARKGREGAAT